MLTWNLHSHAMCLLEQAKYLFLSPDSIVSLLPQGPAGHEK